MIIDKIVGYFSPKSAYQRAAFRKAADKIRKYEGASKGRRTKNWCTSGASSNLENKYALKTLRDRARDLVRNDPHAARASDLIANNVVGKGIMPQLPEGDLAASWAKWTRSTACDISGLLNYAAIQRSVMKNTVVSGEILCKKVLTTDKEFPLKLQLLESDYLPIESVLEKKKNNNNRLVQGIEVDKFGAPQFYHLYKEHPGSGSDEAKEGYGQLLRVGRDDIAHIFRPDRPGQLRGVSWFAPVMILAKDFSDFQDAQLLKQKVSALFAGFIKDLDGDLVEDDDDDELEFEPGSLQKLPPGMDISFSDPPTLEFYKEFINTVLHSYAAGMGISYEGLTGDLSQVNFSSARMGWLEMNRNFDCWRDQLVNTQLNNRVLDWFIESQRLVGKSYPPLDYVPNWTPPKREMIDPTKEVPAKIKAIRAGLDTFSDSIRERGKDPESHFAELKSDKDKIDELELVLDSDASKKSQNGNNVVGTGDTDESSQGNDQGEV